MMETTRVCSGISDLFLLASAPLIRLGSRQPKWLLTTCLMASLAGLSLCIAPHPAQAGGMLLVSTSNTSTAVSKYDAITGATLNAAFIITGSSSLHGLAVDGSNHVFVSNTNVNTVGEYNATTGAALNPALIVSANPLSQAIVLDGNNHLFLGRTVPVGNGFDGGVVSQYDATTGATINATLINPNQGFNLPGALALDEANNRLYLSDPSNNNVAECDATTGGTTKYTFAHLDTYGLAVDGLGHVFAANRDGNTVYELNATTGAIINANFITGLNVPIGLVLDDSNHLFVTNAGNNTVGEYNATTGASINAAFINIPAPGSPGSIVFVSAVPEPSVLMLLLLGVAGTGLQRRSAS